MPKTYNLEPIKQALNTAQDILILLPQNPDLDAVAAGLALYLSLKKKNLSASIGCATPMTVNLNRLFAVDKIKQHIGNQNLVITFDYPEDSLEKVSYDKDVANQKFHITVEPKASMTTLDPQSVNYSYTGAKADLIFVIASRTLEDLGSLYQTEKALFDKPNKTLVNLSHLDNNNQFGTVNIYDPTASGSCEITATVLSNLDLPLDADIATNLLAGIEASSANFSAPNLTADTFSTVAHLISQGGKKGYLSSQPSPTQPSLSPFDKTASFSTPTIPRFPSQPSPRPISPSTSTTPTQRPITQPPFSTPPDQPQSQVPTPPPSRPASPDWLKPKVVKSSSTKI